MSWTNQDASLLEKLMLNGNHISSMEAAFKGKYSMEYLLDRIKKRLSQKVNTEKSNSVEVPASSKELMEKHGKDMDVFCLLFTIMAENYRNLGATLEAVSRFALDPVPVDDLKDHLETLGVRNSEYISRQIMQNFILLGKPNIQISEGDPPASVQFLGVEEETLN